MLEPRTFPKLKEGFFEIAEEIPINNSGIDVARAIIIKEAVNLEILKKCAILFKEIIINVELAIKTIDTRIKKNKFKINIFFLFYFQYFRLLYFYKQGKLFKSVFSSYFMKLAQQLLILILVLVLAL
jgi:hypothetical protein